MTPENETCPSITKTNPPPEPLELHEKDVEAAMDAFWKTWPSFREWWESLKITPHEHAGFRDLPPEPFEQAIKEAIESSNRGWDLAWDDHCRRHQRELDAKVEETVKECCRAVYHAIPAANGSAIYDRGYSAGVAEAFTVINELRESMRLPHGRGRGGVDSP